MDPGKGIVTVSSGGPENPKELENRTAKRWVQGIHGKEEKRKGEGYRRRKLSQRFCSWAVQHHEERGGGGG